MKCINWFNDQIEVMQHNRMYENNPEVSLKRNGIMYNYGAPNVGKSKLWRILYTMKNDNKPQYKHLIYALKKTFKSKFICFTGF